MRSSANTVRFSAPVRAVVVGAGNTVPRHDASDLEKGRQLAFEEGVRAGREQWEKETEQRAEAALKKLHDIMTGISRGFQETQTKLHQLLPELVVEMARRVFAGIEPDRARLLAIVREGLSELPPETSGITVSLCPADLALLSQEDTDSFAAFPAIRFVSDRSLTAGDCVMQSEFGIVDGRVEVKLTNLAASLR